MKYTLLSLLLMTSVSVQARAIPHLDLEMTGEEYRQLFAAMKHQPKNFRSEENQTLLAILELGKRNLDWINLINQHRVEAERLQLTTPGTTVAYPIESPGVSNPKIIENNLLALKQDMPIALSEVIWGEGELPVLNPVSDETFIDYARKLNHIYEAASRWLLEEPYLAEYKQRAQQDIRGYYFLNQVEGLDTQLVHWDDLENTAKQKYSTWLISECMNSSPDFSQCNESLTDAIKSGTVLEYHTKYQPQSARIYADFFELQNPRPEAIWNSSNPEIMHFPFATPELAKVQTWFKSNVEDEFHLNSWALQIEYQQGDHLAKLEFEPGTTPHVNDAGDTITMDANRDLNEYAITWTIRHEFGHVLGFPDCYIEFYDEQKEVMINYQLDTSNLMCSRRGHLQPKHFEQLKKHYFKE